MLTLLIPTGSDHDRQTWPVITWGLISLNTALFVGGWLWLDPEPWLRRWGFVAADPQPVTWLTHMFLHGGWLHLIGNLLYLWFAGCDLEDALGRVRFALVYLLGGLASAGLFWITAVAGGFDGLTEPAVGASGAISALLGLYLVRFPRFKIRLWFGAIIPFPLIIRQGVARISSWFFIGFWIALQLVFGVHALKAGGAEVAYWGHIGGFLLGLAYGLATRQWRAGAREFLWKEAEHLFYQSKWYSALEAYQKLARRHPLFAPAYIKWALCWECAGNLKRAEQVLFDAERQFSEQGCAAETQLIRAEIEQLLGAREADTIDKARQQRARELTGQPPQAAPSVLFRREFKWKAKKP